MKKHFTPVVEVLVFLMGYESYLRKQRISVYKNIVIRYVSVISLLSICK
jgi:hypothetical protein